MSGATPAGWRWARWGDLATLEYGRALRDYRSGVGDTPVFGTNGQIGMTTAAPLADAPGVIVGRKGAYRGIHFATTPFFVIDTAFYLKPSVDLDLKWAYYELLTHDINGMDSGSAIPSTSRPSFYAMRVLVPPMAEQRAIAGVLRSLDEKVEANRRRVSVIDELIPIEFAALPVADTEPVQLGEVATLRKGVSYRSAELAPSTTAMISLKCVGRTGDFQEEGLKQYVGDPRDDQIVEPGELLVAQTDLTQGAEVVGRVVCAPAGTAFTRLVASLDLAIVRPKPAIEREYLYATLLHPNFRSHCVARTSGTTVLHLASDALPSFEFALHSPDVRAAFAEAIRPLLAERDRASTESRLLAELRDTLLPELLSGRLRIEPARGLVESVSR